MIGKILLGLLALPVLLLAFIGFRYLIRGTPVRKIRAGASGTDRPPGVSDPSFVPTMELLAKTHFNEGHAVKILVNGDATYPELWELLRSATRSITMQMYYSNAGELADTLAEILCERARAGVRVLFLRDAFGAAGLGKDFNEKLRAAGVDVAVFRPLQWWALEKSYNRSHIRVVVVDGQEAMTGGFGIDDKWMGDGMTPDSWRETNVRFTGPAVSQLQGAFAAGWAEATGELLAGPLWFPEAAAPAPPGGVHAAILHTAPTVGSPPAERYLAFAIGSARERLWITNAYFAPDADFVHLLIEAAKRGVDVRVLTAGDNIDVKSTLYAGRGVYETLLEGGVRLFEYSPSMVHAKTIVMDRCFASIGTMNFDNRSMSFNDETTLMMVDDRIGREMEELYERDLRYSTEVELEVFRQRGGWERVKERAMRAVVRIL